MARPSAETDTAPSRAAASSLVDSSSEQAPTWVSSMPYLILLTLVFTAAITPILIRQAQNAGVPSLFIIAARLMIVSGAMMPYLFTRHRDALRQITRSQWMYMLIAAVILVCNLTLLFVALEYTSVLVNSVLRRTTPLWSIILESTLMGAIFTRRIWVGIAMALTGSALVALGAAGAAGAGIKPELGAAMSIVDAIMASGYLIVGRKLRGQMPTAVYSGIVWGFAAVIALGIAIAAGVPFSGYSVEGYFWVLSVAFVAQFVAHFSLNISVQKFAATYISVILQTTVVISAGLALIFYGEIPTVWQVIGSAGVIAGVILVTMNPRREYMKRFGRKPHVEPPIPPEVH